MSNLKEEMKLLMGWASPFAMRAEIALKLKGISYESLPENLHPKSQLLLESNPVYKKIPVLIHNGKPICESSIIVQYIDEAWPENVKLLPSDPYERARTKFWGDFFDNKFFKALIPGLASAKAVPKVNEELAVCFADIEKELAKEGRTFFGGEDMNYADVMLAPFVQWFIAIPGIEMAKPEDCPHAHKLFEAILEHPVAKTVLPSMEKLQAFVVQRFPNRLNN